MRTQNTMYGDNLLSGGTTSLGSSYYSGGGGGGGYRHHSRNRRDDDCQPCPPCPPGPAPQPGPPGPCPSNDDFQQEIENDADVQAMIEEIIATIPAELCGVRPPRHSREVVRQRSRCPPRVATIRRRLPSPEGDMIERITVISPPQDHINIIIEKPSMPGPCISQREEYDQNLPPVIHRRVVCVPPRSGGGGGGCCPPGPNPCTPCAPCPAPVNPCAPYGGNFGGGGGTQQFYGQGIVSSYGSRGAFQQGGFYPQQQQQAYPLVTPLSTRQQWGNVVGTPQTQWPSTTPWVGGGQTMQPMYGGGTSFGGSNFQQQQPFTANTNSRFMNTNSNRFW